MIPPLPWRTKLTIVLISAYFKLEKSEPRIYKQQGVSLYLLIALDSESNALQLGVTDLSELVLRHGNHPIVLGDELAAVTNKEAVITRKCLQDL